jgi:hypothetical protein
MELPSTVHPLRIDINGFIYEVVSYGPLTNEQAAEVALIFHRLHKPRKKDRGKVLRCVVPLDGSDEELQ